jgi:hypothetical protein
MMQNTKQLPVYSGYRHSPFQTGWHQPYVPQEHVTTASQRHDQKTFTYNPNRPHLNIRLEDEYVVRALVDSGSSDCFGDSS